MENILIYLLLLVIFIVLSFLKKKKKQVAPVSSQTKPTTTSAQQDNENDFLDELTKEFKEEFFLELDDSLKRTEKKVTPSPKEQFPKKKIKTAFTPKKTFSQPGGIEKKPKQQTTPFVSEDPYTFTDENAIKVSEETDLIDINIDLTDENEIKKAIIFSEILNRKYF